MSNVTSPTVITLRCGSGGPPHATADWNELEYWSCGPDAVADVARRLLADGYPANRGWERHDVDGELASGHTLHQLYRPPPPAPAPALNPKPAPAPRVQIRPDPVPGGLLPAGDYVFEIVETDVRDNSAGTGNYILLVLEGLGAAEGHAVRDYLNLKNPSPWAEAQARKRLAQIGHSLDNRELTNTDQLLGKRLEVTLRIKPATDGYEACNAVVRYGRP
jgi:hypothetical protein